jgi:hypothetical protein
VTSARRRRGAAAALVARVAFVACACVCVLACTETRRPLGEACLKNGDCLSGVCSGLTCAATPPLLDGAPDNAPDAAGVDAEAGAGDAPDGASPDDSAAGDANVGG